MTDLFYMQPVPAAAKTEAKKEARKPRRSKLVR